MTISISKSLDSEAPGKPEASRGSVASSGLDCWFWAGWEPLRHYRRAGKSGSPFFGKGAWLPKWEERKFSDDLIARAVDLGATIVITEFFKGFGRTLESQNWPRLKDFVDRCHRGGLKVWGYAQGRSIYYETLGSEVEDWRSWVAKTIDGKDQTFANAYFRAAPCLSSQEYAKYLASTVFDGVGEIGFDGVHLDNAYYSHCWCPRCSSLFREWLEDRGDFEETVGIPLSKHVQPPPLPPKGGVGLDPLQILWLQFGVDVRLKFFRTLREQLVGRLPHLVISGNPAFPRADTAMISRCVDPSREAEAFDYLCCENGNLPRIDGGWIGTQTEAHLLAEAGGYQIWTTSWRESGMEVSPPETPGGIWAGLAEEYSFGRVLGNNWAFRPAGEGARFISEDAHEMTDAFREAVRFFQRLDAELLPGRRKTWAEVAIYHDPLSASLCGDAEIRLNQALQQFLFKRGIPFHIVLPDQPVPESVRYLVVFHVGAISDRTLNNLKEFAGHSSKTLWLAGNSAQNDQWFVPRDRRDLAELRNAPGIHYTPAFGETWQRAYLRPVAAASNAGAGYFASRSLQTDPEEAAMFDAFFGSPIYRPSIRFERPEKVLIHSQKTENGRVVFHLRDQSGSGELLHGVRIVLEAGFPKAKGWQIIRPNHEAEALQFCSKSGDCFAILPPFQHYAIVIADLSTASTAGR